MAVTLPDGTVITDDTSPATGLKAGGHRTRFYPCLSAIATWAAQVQSWAAQAQAAAGAGGGTIFPTVNSTNAGQSLAINTTGSAYIIDSAIKSLSNKIYNPDFKLWQRGTSFAPTSLSAMYTADRFACLRAGGVAGLTVTKQIAAVGNSIRLQRDSGNTSTAQIFITQSLPSVDVVGLAGRDINIMIKAKKGTNYSEASSLLGIYVLSGVGADSNPLSGFTSQQNVLFFPVLLSTTEQTFRSSCTLPANTTQLAIQLAFAPTGTAGANDWFELSYVGLYEGLSPGQEERRPKNIELMICEPFYEKSYDVDINPGAVTTAGCITTINYSSSANGDIVAGVNFRRKKYKSPAITVYGAAGGSGKISNNAGSDLAASSGVATSIGQSSCRVYNNSGGSLTPSAGGYCFHYTADGEL